MSGMKRFGNYFLLKKIATGGMAELYKAKKSGEKGFEKLLAIKMILPHLAASDEFISMFIDEAKVAALLNHQNIVQIYDLGRIEDSYCIVMEYVRGKDLRSVISRAIKSKTPIKMEHACLITANTLAGLSYAHRKRDKGKELHIVHRDISPQNILISYEGEVKIVDFGIAKAATQSRDTQAGVLKGKISYMSPEQALGKPLDMRSDVFSTGVVLYEMLTGRKLFQGDTDISTLEMVRAARVEPLPSKLSKSFPAELEQILLKALAKEPENRYQSAADMEAALLEFMRSAGYSTSSYSLSEYMHRIFREEIEQEIRQEQELDATITTLSVESSGGREASSKTVTKKTVPATQPPGPAARTAARPAPRAPEPRKQGRGGLFIAVVVVVVLALGGVWAGAKFMHKRRATALQAQPNAIVSEPALPAPSTGPEEESAVPEEGVPVQEQESAGVQPDVNAPATVMPAPANKPVAVPDAVDASPPPAQAPARIPLAPSGAVISSEPAGAEVYVDGNPAGRTPLSVTGLTPDKTHDVRLTLDGYNDWAGSFSAEPGGTATVTAQLKMVAFIVEASSSPPGARVLLDGADTGRVTPARLEGLTPGRRYTFRLELDGYKPYERPVSLDGPGIVEVKAELERLFGELTINTRPWAFVIVDGENKGMTPLAGIRLGAGEHQVVLKNPKLKLAKKLNVRIRPDETTRIVIDLGNSKR